MVDLEKAAATGFKGLPILPLTSISGAASFLECPRRYFWKSVVRLQPRFGERSYETGRKVHEMLDRYHKAGSDPAAMRKYLAGLMAEADAKAPTDRDLEDLELTLVTCRAVADVYPDWERAQKPALQVLASEWPFHHTQSKTGLSGRIDVLGSVADGPWAGRWVMDYKTGTLGRHSEIVERTPFSKQARLYCLETGARGVIWSIVAKTASRRRQKESREEYLARVSAEYKAEPDKYFKRFFEPVKAGTVLNDLAGVRALHGCARGRYKALGVSAFPQNESACHTFGRCPFLDLCRGAAPTLYTVQEARHDAGSDAGQ